MIATFSSTYICEQTFALVIYRKNKYCCRLRDERVNAFFTNAKSDINKLPGNIRTKKAH